MKSLSFLLVMCSLAGCLGSDAPPTTPGSAQTTSPTESEEAPCVGVCGVSGKSTLPAGKLELLDCQSYFLIYAGDTQKMADELPPGYEPAADAANVKTMGLNLYTCGTAVIDNASVERDVTLFMVVSLVAAPDAYAHPDYNDLYLFEVVSNSPAIQAIYAANNFTVLKGSASVAAAFPNLEIQFSLESPLYEYVAAGILGNGSDESITDRRMHQAGTFADWHEEAKAPPVGEVGTLTTHGGAVSRTMANPGTATAANSGIGWVDIVISFGKTVTNT